MKFIRDIIAEKAKMTEENNADPTSQAHLEDRDGEIDTVDLVASGGRTLGRDGHSVYFEGDELGTSEDENADLMQDGSEKFPEVETGFDEEENFDLLSDPLDPAEATDPNGHQEPAELFADIWGDEAAEYQNNDPEDDIFASALPATDEEPASMNTPDPVPETNTEALMRTIYQTSDEDPFAQPAPSDQIAHPIPSGADEQAASSPEFEEDPVRDAGQEQAGSPDASPFQRIIRRQQSVPVEAENAPAPEIETAPVPEPSVEISHEPIEPVKVPAPAAGRARRQAGRVKTRLLGFSNDNNRGTDLFAPGDTPVPSAQTMHPVGWIAVVSGPGRGTAFTLFNGVSQIGRGEDQAIRLDLGDNSISRSNHAAIAYDPEQRGFFLGHGGKANLVRLNGNPVLSTEPLPSGALIKIGETTLRFVALCGPDFDWDKTQDGEGENARFG